MQRWVIALLVACAEEPDSRARPELAAPEVDVVPLALVGPECSELVEVSSYWGAAGGFHADLGVLAQAPHQEIAVAMTVRDPQTGEVLASAYGGEAFVALVGWTEDAPEGWAPVRVSIAEGQNSLEALEVACALGDGPVEVEATVRDLFADDSATISGQVAASFVDPDGRCD